MREETRETHLASLNLDNDYSTYNELMAMAEEEIEAGGEAFRLAEKIEDMVSEPTLSEMQHGLLRDLLTYALAQVDWVAIAQGYIDTAKEASR